MFTMKFRFKTKRLNRAALPMAKRVQKLVYIIAMCVVSTAISQENSGSDTKVIGQYYVADTYKDWQKLCLTTGQAVEPCYMYQLIEDDTSHPTAEFTILKVNEEEGISAAATIMTPLETLLTRKMSLSVDGQDVREYPYSWCDRRGCYARVALTDDDIFGMKKGRAGYLEIESIAAPGKVIRLKFSLSGFTDAFGSL